MPGSESVSERAERTTPERSEGQLSRAGVKAPAQGAPDLGRALRTPLTQEALEVPRDRVGRGDPLLGGILSLDLVHSRLQPLDERLDLRVARHRRADLG